MSSGSGKSKEPEADEPTLYDAPRVSLPSDDDDNMPTIALDGAKPLLKPPAPKAPPPKAPAPKPPPPKPAPQGIPADTPLGESGDVTMDSQQVAFDVLARAAFKKGPAASAAATPPATPPAPSSASGSDFESTQYLVATNPSGSMSAAKAVAAPAANPLAAPAVQGPSIVVESTGSHAAQPAQPNQPAKRPPPLPVALIIVAAVMGLAVIGLVVFFVTR